MLNISGLNKANYDNCVYWNNQSGNVSNVGENGSSSFLGTYDQNGNVSEWISENSFIGGTGLYTNSMMVLGGSYQDNALVLSSEYLGRYSLPILGVNYNTFSTNSDIGFRIAADDPYAEHPVYVQNIIPISGKSWTERFPYNTMWGLTADGSIVLVNPDLGLSYIVLQEGVGQISIGASGFNGGAYDKDSNTTIFYANMGNSGLYSWNNTSNVDNIELSGVYNSFEGSEVSPWVNSPVYNAAYYASGYWYFDQQGSGLNKVHLAYDTGYGYVEATGKETWNVGLPIDVSINSFGDISIDTNSGILYATTIYGNIYSINILPTITGGVPVTLNSGYIHGDVDGVLLQTSLGYDNTLYGHHYDSSGWYKINISDDLGYATRILNHDSVSSFVTYSFTDLLGSRKAGINFGPGSKVYGINKLPVTNAEYVNYLNHVDPNGHMAQTSVEFNEYNQYVVPHTGIVYSYLMGSSDEGGILLNENQSVGQKYVSKRYMEGKPVNFVSFPMAAQYCNWLHNLVDNPETKVISSGAYDLSTDSLSGGTLTVSSGARYYLPYREEWYMPAYYYTNNVYTTGSIDISTINNINNNIMQLEDVLGIYTVFAPTGSYIRDDNTWLKVDQVSNYDQITTITFNKPLTKENYLSNYINNEYITVYNVIPTGLTTYATNSNVAPECSDIDQYGNGPKIITNVQTLLFNDLAPGKSYRVSVSIVSSDEYPAYLPYETNRYSTRTFDFVPNTSNYELVFVVERYWSTLTLVLQYVLSQNVGNSWVEIESQNILVKCENIDTNCIDRIPRTPLPTTTPTPTLTRTNTPTPSVTVTMSQTRTPNPTTTVTPSVTPTQSVTPTESKPIGSHGTIV
jgi:hypothetical protein